MPSLLILHDGTLDKPLEDALSKEAKKYAGDLLVVRVDAIQNPDTHLRYGEPALPALVTFTDAAKVKSDAVQVRPKDVRDHINHLLKDKPLPQQKSAAGSASHPLIVTDQTFRKEVLKSKIPVLVDFWATWCGPCLREMPASEQLKNHFMNKDVEFVYVSVDEDANKWRAFLDEKGWDKKYHLLNDGLGLNSPVTNTYNIKGVPKYVIIDKNGIIRDSNAKRPSEMGVIKDIEGALRK